MKEYLDINRLEEAASRLRAIAHPLRIAIIGYLEDEGECSVTQIYEALEIEQATASHHLNILKSKGVLKSVRDGKKTFYSVKPDSILKIVDCLNKCDS